MNGAAYHNPENERTIRRLRDGGMKPSAIARTIGITRSTVYWYIDKWLREECVAIVDDGPPAVERPTCRVCHGASATWAGHDDCTGKGRIPAVRRSWRRAVA